MTIPDKSPDRITPGKPLEPLGTSIPSSQTPSGFESYMQGAKQSPPTPTSGINPMEAPRGPSIPSSGITFDSLLAQASQTQDSLGTVEQQLNDKNLKLKRSQSHLVRQKLTDANGYLRTAGAKLGLEPSETKMPPGLSGISRFVAMINDGQDQLAAVQEKLKKLSQNGETINPGEMMSIQVKMGMAQQEISYTSTLLGKVIQSITQLMNTQL